MQPHAQLDAKKDQSGLYAPDSSFLPPLRVNEPASKDDDVASSESREVLNYMVRLEFDIV